MSTMDLETYEGWEGAIIDTSTGKKKRKNTGKANITRKGNLRRGSFSVLG